MPFRSERLKELREQQGYTQREFSAVCGVSETQISRYEKDRMLPTLPNLELIAHHLDVSIDYLVGLIDEPHKHFGDRNMTDEESLVLDTYRRENWSGIAQLSVEKLSEMVEALEK